MWQITISTESGDQPDPDAFEVFLDAVHDQLDGMGVENLALGCSLQTGEAEWQFTVESEDFEAAAGQGLGLFRTAQDRARAGGELWPDLRVTSGRVEQVSFSEARQPA